MALLFDVYKSNAPPCSNLALECLVRLASVRRSLFASETERNAYLQRLIVGTAEASREEPRPGRARQLPRVLPAPEPAEDQLPAVGARRGGGLPDLDQGGGGVHPHLVAVVAVGVASVYYLLALWSA